MSAMSAFKAPVVFTAVDKITKPMRRIAQAAGGMAAKINHASSLATRGFHKMRSAIVSTAGSMGIFLGVAAGVGVLVNGVKTFAEYERSISKLGAISNSVGPPLNRLKDQARLLGATTAFTATQVVGMQTELAKLGFKEENKEITNMTGSVLALASATGTEASQAAKQLGAAMRMFNMEGQKAAGDVADVLAAATVETGQDMEFLETALVKIGPTAKTMGFDIASAASMLGILANAGFDASTAGTSTRNLMLKMSDPASKLAQALGRPVKSMDDLRIGLSQMSKFDIAQMLEVSDMRAVGSLATYVRSLKDLDQVFDKIDKAQKGGATAAKIMAVQNDNLIGGYKKMISAMEDFSIHTGESNGGLKDMIKNTMAVIGAFFNLQTGMREQARANLALKGTTEQLANFDKITKWAKALDVALQVLLDIALVVAGYKVLMLAWAGGAAVVSSAMLVLTSIAGAFGLTLSAAIWPITLTVAAIGALSFAIFQIVKNWNTWGKEVVSFVSLFNPLHLLIRMTFSVVDELIDSWQALGKVFSEKGFVSGIVAIGKVIASGLLAPLEQVLSLVDRFTGTNLAATIESARKSLSVKDILKVSPEQNAISRNLFAQQSGIIGPQISDVNNPNSSGEILGPLNPDLMRQKAQEPLTASLTVENASDSVKLSKGSGSNSMMINIESSRL
ncbi:MAG: phage tail tape measure protein [Psychroserpens sp.]|nr:phage tail tape measure protein [Psychroserpens sp.]